jgi:hypothetical protein
MMFRRFVLSPVLSKKKPNPSCPKQGKEVMNQKEKHAIATKPCRDKSCDPR